MAASQPSVAVLPFDCFSTLVDRHGGPAASFLETEEYQKVWRASRFTTSTPLDDRLWYRVQHTKASLKSHVRAGVTPSTRRKLWLEMTGVSDEDVVLYSRALGKQENQGVSLDGFVARPPSNTPSFSQTSQFNDAYCRVIYYTMDSAPNLSHCPLLPLLGHLLLHFLEEWECFTCLMNLAGRQGWLDRTRAEAHASVLTLVKLMETNLQGVHLTSIKPVGMSDEVFLTEALANWYLWPFVNLPFWIAVRVLDLYILEGPKILYRLALSAIKLFYQSPQFEMSKIEGVTPSQLLPEFLSTLSVEELGEWIQQGLAISRLSWKGVFRIWLQNLSKAECMPLEQSQSSPGIRRVMSRGRKPIKVDPSSEILTNELCDGIADWFPEWCIGSYLACYFQTNKHGYNLRTLYSLCEREDPIILVIKTSDHAIFGAFVHGSLTDRHNNTFFGSGETFLFSIEPKKERYYWTAESDLILRANDEEMIIGSGGGQFGIWFDGDLNRGSTAMCKAYNNPPLTGTDVVDFKCLSVEVFILTED